MTFFGDTKAARPAPRRRQGGFVQVLILVLIMFGATTFGLVAFQSEIVKRKSQSAKATPAALDAGRKGLLEYMTHPPSPPFAFTGNHGVETFPDSNFVYVGDDLVSHTDDIRIPFRPGQLPCPDTIGDSTDTYPDEVPRGIRGVNDGVLDGVSDYGLERCSRVATNLGDPLANDSNFGRLPWREFTDFANYARGVAANDIRDGNKDRLWYAASPNLLRPDTPINPYKIRRTDDNWLAVTVSTHVLPGAAQATTTVTLEAAAVVMSPGTPTSAQTSRIDEDTLLSSDDGLMLSIGDTATAELYLELENDANDLYFTHNAGPAPPSADRLAFITREEVLGALAKQDPNKHLDSIADSLANYYDRNKHLPDPATFESHNSEYIVRRQGRASDGLNQHLLSPLANPVHNPAGGLDLLRLQGGRVDYGIAPSALDGGDLRARGSSDIVRVSGSISANDMPYIYLPHWLSLTVTTNAPDSDVITVPLNEHIHALGSPRAGSPHNSRWFARVPAGTPVRAALPFYSNQDANAAALLASTNADITIGTSSDGTAGSYDSMWGDFNVLFPDLRQGILGNLSEYGYSALMPRGTWLIPDADLWIYGPGELLTVSGNISLAVAGFAYNVDPASETSLSYGVARSFDPSAPTALAVPANTPVVAGSQGLLPTPTFPRQLDAAADGQSEAVAVETGSTGAMPVIGVPEVIRRNHPNDVAQITDPNGAIGYFPGEVTLFPTHRVSIDTTLSTVQITIDTIPVSNRYPTYSVPDGPETPITNYFAAFGIDLQFDDDEGPDLAVVEPYPYMSGDDVIMPTALRLNAGYVTVPAGAKFLYPTGSWIPLGKQAFALGGTGGLFKYDGTNPALKPGAPSQELDVKSTSPRPAVARITAHLPPGAVVNNAYYTVENAVRPDGSNVDATQVSTYIQRLTLVNGGALSFARMLFYDEGRLSQVPLNNVQAGYRVEAMGMELFPTHQANINLSSPFADDLDEIRILMTLAARNANYAISSVELSDGYHLYPYHDVVVPMSRRLAPLAAVTTDIDDNVVADASSHAVTTYIDNPTSRAALRVASASGVSLEVAAALNRNDLISTSADPSFTLVDERGVGVEFDSENEARAQFPISHSQSAGDNFNNALDVLNLDFGGGVDFQVNPGRISHAPVDSSSGMVALNQFGAHERSTPLTAPFSTGGREASYATDLDSALVDAAINPRVAETAFKINPAASLNTYGFEDAETVAASDSLVFNNGTSYNIRLNTDSYLFDSDAPQERMLVPSGSQLEFGLIDQEHFAVAGTAVTVGNPRFGRGSSNFLVPGGRVFSGVGSYGLPGDSEMRFARDQVSFSGPDTMVVALRSNSGASTITMDFHEQTSTDVDPFEITVIQGSTPAGALEFTPDTQMTLYRPKLILPAGTGADAGRITTVVDSDISNAPFTAPISFSLEYDQPSLLPVTITVYDTIAVVITTTMVNRVNEITIENNFGVTGMYSAETTLAITFGYATIIRITDPGPPPVEEIELRPLGDVATVNGVTIFSFEGDVNLPAGISVSLGEAPAYAFDPDVAIGFDFMVLSNADGDLVTLNSEVLKHDDSEILAYLDDEPVWDFNFTAMGRGAVTSPKPGTSPPLHARYEDIRDGQHYRYSLERTVVSVSADPLFNTYQYLPTVKVAWGGSDSQLGFLDFDPNSLIFSQNNPLFYAVADRCRQPIANLQGGCSEQEHDEGDGLSALALPNTDVRMPQSTVAPAGVVIHGHRIGRNTPSRVVVNGQVTLSGVRLLPDGTLEPLTYANAPNLNELVAQSPVPAGFSFSPGDPVTIEAANRLGLAFRLEEPGIATIRLGPADNPVGSVGHTEPVTLRVGGFTLDRERLAAYKLTVPAASTVTMAQGSVIGLERRAPDIIEAEFGDGSTFEMGADIVDIGGYHIVEPSQRATVVLGSDVARRGEGLDVPIHLSGGQTIDITSSGAVIDNANAPRIGLDLNDSIEMGQGYVWQGYIQAHTYVTATLSAGPGTPDPYLGLRNYNFGVDNLDIRYRATTNPSAVVGPRQRSITDIAIPQHHSLENDWLTSYATITSFTDEPIRVTLQPQTTSSCSICITVTMDISSLSSIGFYDDNGTDIDVHYFENPITVDVQRPTSLALPVNVGFTNTAIDDISGAELFSDMTYLNISFMPPSPIPDPAIVTLVIGPHLGFFLEFNDLRSTVSYELLDFSGLANREYTDDDGATQLNLQYTADDPDMTAPSHSASQDVADDASFELPTSTGFSIERYGNASNDPAMREPLAIAIGEALAIPAPSAVYRRPQTQWDLTQQASWTGTALEAPREAGQLLLDRRIVGDGTPSDTIDYQELSLMLDDNIFDREVAIHVPVPMLTLSPSNTELPAGSILYPETGYAYVAQTLDLAAPLALTLGAEGAIAYVAGAAGAGRPAIHEVVDTYIIGNAPEYTHAFFNTPRAVSISAMAQTINVSNPPFGQRGDMTVMSEDTDGVTLSLNHIIIRPPAPADTYHDIDTRAMDAVLRDPAIFGRDNINLRTNNYATDPQYEFAPANHRISLNGGEAITILPFSTSPEGDRSFVFPTDSTLFAHAPTTVDSTAMIEVGVSGLAVDMRLESFISDLQEYTFTLTTTATPPVAITTTLTVAASKQLVQHTEEPIGSHAGLNQDISMVQSDLYQNVWVRVNNDVELDLGGGNALTLASGTVINPLLGTYLLPVQDDFTAPVESVRINAPSDLVVSSEMVLSGPALTLPKDLTLAIGSQPARFEGVRAIIGHSPRPLASVTCASRGTALQVNQIEERADGSTTATIPQVTFSAILNRFSLTDANGVDPDSPQFGDANKCMLLDLPENTDLDKWFVLGTFDSEQGASNDLMRMVGGRLSVNP